MAVGAIYGTGDWNIRRRSRAALVRFNVGCPDHLAPLLGFIGDELAEFGGRHRQWNAAQVCQPLLDLRIGEAAVISLLSLPTISAGVSLGAPIPNQPLAS